MSGIGDIPTFESIMAKHNKLSGEQEAPDQQNSPVQQVQKNRQALNIIWMRYRNINKEIESLKYHLEGLGQSAHKKQLSHLTRTLEDTVNSCNVYIKKIMDEMQMRGKTGVFDLAQVSKSIYEMRQKELDPKPSHSIPPQQQQPSGGPQKSNKISLKPVGQKYGKPGQEIILANNKLDDSLYVVDLSTRKVVARPEDITELFNDTQLNRIIALIKTTTGNGLYFADIVNNKFLSGPFTHIKDVVFTHRYKNILLSQIFNTEGVRSFINVDTGEQIKERDLYDIFK